MDLRPLERFIFDKMASSRLPGLSLAIVEGDRVSYSRGFGQRDLANGLPATPDTLYSIGSVTKSFTALAVMQLAERGLLDPRDPVDRFLPFDIRPMGEAIRLEHLLSHSSGIPALAYSEALISHANGTGGRWLPIAGPDDILTFMDGAGEWAESAPGERWAYSNEGYALLGLIVEKVSGQSYSDYLRENILAPLGMERTFLNRSQVEAEADKAVPYVLAPGEQPRPGHYLYRRIRSEGGLISSVSDLARYVAMFLAQGAGVASPATVEALARPRVSGPQLSSGVLDSGEEATRGWGYGLVSDELLGRKLVGHGGNVLVSTAHLAFLPEERLGVAVLANGEGYPLGHIARAALATVLGQDPGVVTAIGVERRLESLCGNYLGYRGTIGARVERQANFLRLRFDGSIPQETILVPEDLQGPEYRFFTLADGLRLPVLFRDEGGSTELLFERHKLKRIGA